MDILGKRDRRYRSPLPKRSDDDNDGDDDTNINAVIVVIVIIVVIYTSQMVADWRAVTSHLYANRHMLSYSTAKA